MHTSISILGVIPGKAEPSHKSEMVSQLLFGEEFQIIEKQNDWVHINSLRDDYNFWIEDKQCDLFATSHEKSANYELSRELFSKVNINNQFIKNTIIPIGSILHKTPNNEYEVNGEKYLIEGQVHTPKPKRSDLIYFANSFLNTPYLWGGKTPLGIDCSGFTQICLRMIGIELPRDAYLQEGKGISTKLIEAQPGDLAFFENSKGKISHVGIILEHNKIIHASGHVKIEPLNEKGIYSPQLKIHTHNLCSIKSFL